MEMETFEWVNKNRVDYYNIYRGITMSLLELLGFKKKKPNNYVSDTANTERQDFLKQSDHERRLKGTCWFVNSYLKQGSGNMDYTDIFVEEGRWENLWDYKFASKIKHIKPGDYIAIKSNYFRDILEIRITDDLQLYFVVDREGCTVDLLNVGSV